MPLPSVEGHPPWNNVPVQQKHWLWFQRRQFSNWGYYSDPNTHCLEPSRCYGTRSWTHLLCHTFTAFNYWFPFHVHRSHRFLYWHFPICCMVTNSPFPYFLSRTLISQVDDASTRFPLVTHVPWPSTTFHFFGLCAYPGHISTAPFVLLTLS